MYVCECGRSFDKPNSLNAHYSHCILHRNGKPPIDRFEGKRGWNKGLSKDTNDRVKLMAEKFSGSNHPNWGKHLSDKTKCSISKSIKGKTGGLRENSNKWKGQYVMQGGNKIWLDSSWEKIFVDRLNEMRIEWLKNTNKWPFDYEFDDKIFKYYPDFFLPSYNLWVEIKGRIHEKDEFKWRDFPFKLIILRSKDDIMNFDLFKYISAGSSPAVVTQDR